MVKNRSLIGLVLPILLLTSCGSRNDGLRSDIADFIASFSLDKSIVEYQEAGYESIREMHISNKVTIEVEKVDFNIKDMSNLSYVHTLVTTIDGEEDSSRIQKIEVVDSKYMYTLDEDTHEVDIEYALTIVNTFFYIQEPIDGYRVRGMYYGDYIKEIASTMQDAITIDQENKLLIDSFRQIDESQGMDITTTLKVNKLGMLVSNEQKFISHNDWITQNITVYNK